MGIGVVNMILDVNIVLGCISLVLNIYVLSVLISRERKFRQQNGYHVGGHLKR